MIELLEQELQKHGDKFKIKPISCLHKLKQDVDEIKNNASLNDYTKEVVNTYYNFDLPTVNFEIRSIIVVASPSPIVKVIFNFENKRISLTLPPAYIDMNSKPVDIEKYLNEFLNPHGYQVKLTNSLPQKMLAVRSGLCVYGRNNICYAGGIGSFLKLSTFYSDIPCTDDFWHELKQMDSCKTCKACMNSCPTKAITEDSYMIKTDHCLTHFNEHVDIDFPEWVDSSAHNCIYGCLKCQTCCPKNRQFLKNIIEPAEFTQEETLSILNGEPLESFSKEFIEKIKILDMFEYFPVLPRNLKVLFNQNLNSL